MAMGGLPTSTVIDLFCLPEHCYLLLNDCLLVLESVSVSLHVFELVLERVSLSLNVPLLALKLSFSLYWLLEICL